MSKSAIVVIVEQLGALLYLAIWAVVMQHFYCYLLGKPEDSWLVKTKVRFLDWRLASERKRFEVWNRKDTAVEPEVSN